MERFNLRRRQLAAGIVPDLVGRHRHRLKQTETRSSGQAAAR
jgi:hypothetical protein